MIKEDACTACRRLYQKLLLKGSKCLSPKCPLIKKSYSPGAQNKKRGKKGISEYKKELWEKQKLKEFYNLSERQFKNYIRQILKKKGELKDAGLKLVRKLEKRLDNVIFRLNFASSRPQARQLVSHGFFLINGKLVNVPSYETKKGEVISLKEQKQTKPFYKEIVAAVKKAEPPSWLKLDKEKIKAEIINEPSLEEANVPVEILTIFEYYSK